MNNKDMPAFPAYLSQDSSGLTTREYFASSALQGLLSIFNEDGGYHIVPNEENAVYMAKLAVKAADALIAALADSEV